MIMFDSNVVTIFIRADHEMYRTMWDRLAREPARAATSTVVHAEQLFGFRKNPKATAELRQVYGLFLEVAPLVAWDERAAEIYAELREATRHRPISLHDCQILAHAVALDAVLLTEDLRLIESLPKNTRFSDHARHASAWAS
ncbi:MAG: PIN domain-containing protein [Geminicoccaceae bacterium]